MSAAGNDSSHTFGSSPPGHKSGAGSVAAENVTQPGAYVCHSGDHLLRVTKEGVELNPAAKVGLVGKEPLFVSKISESPFVTLTKARIIAANSDLFVGF